MDASEAVSRTNAAKANVSGRGQAVQDFINGKLQEAADAGEKLATIYSTEVIEPGLKLGSFNANTIKTVYEAKGYFVELKPGRIVISWSHLL